MDTYKIYILALFACGIASLAIAFWAFKMNDKKLPDWEALPRNSKIGVVLAFFCLLWCVPHAKPIVWTWMLNYLYPLVVTFTILSYLYLDYLFSRAVGGFFILLTYYFVHQAFTFHTPIMGIFSIACWCLGILGLFFSGKPHLMRDFIRKLAKSSKMRYGTSAYFLFFGVLSLVLGTVHALRG